MMVQKWTFLDLENINNKQNKINKMIISNKKNKLIENKHKISLAFKVIENKIKGKVSNQMQQKRFYNQLDKKNIQCWMQVLNRENFKT